MLTRLAISTLIISSLALSPVAFAKTKDKSPTAPHTAPERVQCEGVFGPDVTVDMIIAHFGAENVEARIEVDSVEGVPVFGTLVYGDDPDRKIAFQWFDEANTRFVSYVDLPPTLATPEGLYVGQTAAEVAALNGEPVSFAGFWWDYGGYVFLHEGGKLWNTEAPCVPMIRFAPTVEEPDVDVTTISGDVTVTSDDPLVGKVGVKVQTAGMGYQYPEGYDGFDEGEPVEE